MNWLTNLEQAKEESLKSYKPILLQFEMDNCGGCKKNECNDLQRSESH